MIKKRKEKEKKKKKKVMLALSFLVLVTVCIIEFYFGKRSAVEIIYFIYVHTTMTMDL